MLNCSRLVISDLGFLRQTPSGADLQHSLSEDPLAGLTRSLPASSTRRRSLLAACESINFTPTALRLAIAVAAALPAIASLPAAASTVSINGDTTAAPTFQRPVEDLSALSMIGTAAHYGAYAFSATSSGIYEFETSGAFDTFVVLYDGSFKPAAGLLNALIANDDLTSTPFNVSGFEFALLAGHAYTYVVTGFDNDEFGPYTTTVVSPPDLNVPEPSTYALVTIGIDALTMLRRRRQQCAAGSMKAAT